MFRELRKQSTWSESQPQFFYCAQLQDRKGTYSAITECHPLLPLLDLTSRNHSAKFRPLIVQLTKADEAPLTIKAEKKNESLPNVENVSAGHDHPRFDDRLRIGHGGKRVNPCDG